MTTNMTHLFPTPIMTKENVRPIKASSPVSDQTTTYNSASNQTLIQSKTTFNKVITDLEEVSSPNKNSKRKIRIEEEPTGMDMGYFIVANRRQEKDDMFEAPIQKKLATLKQVLDFDRNID